jgi:hypothetical protein
MILKFDANIQFKLILGRILDMWILKFKNYLIIRWKKKILSHNIVKQISSLIQVMSKFNTHNVPSDKLKSRSILNSIPT